MCKQTEKHPCLFSATMKGISLKGTQIERNEVFYKLTSKWCTGLFRFCSRKGAQCNDDPQPIYPPPRPTGVRRNPCDPLATARLKVFPGLLLAQPTMAMWLCEHHGHVFVKKMFTHNNRICMVVFRSNFATPVSPLGHQFVLAIREKLTILADGGHTVWDVYIEYVVVLRKESTTQKRHFLLLSILPPG